jgi:hypothetical protein
LAYAGNRKSAAHEVQSRGTRRSSDVASTSVVPILEIRANSQAKEKRPEAITGNYH